MGAGMAGGAIGPGGVGPARGGWTAPGGCVPPVGAVLPAAAGPMARGSRPARRKPAGPGIMARGRMR